MRQTIKNRGEALVRAFECTRKSEITPVDLKFMSDFTKAADATFSAEGKSLKQRLMLASSFYKSVNSGAAANAVKSTSGYLPGIDPFLASFIKNYKENPSFRDSLVVNLMKGYVAKVDGVKNPQYGLKVLNFFLALSASGDKRAFEFVSGNLAGVSLRWMKHLTAKKRPPPFIHVSDDDLVQRITSHVSKIRASGGNPKRRVALSIGIDATALVPTFQVAPSHGAIVGGQHPNDMLSIVDKSPEQVKELLKECNEGKYGDAAPEIKCVIVSFQDTPPGMSPYFTLTGYPQSVNKNSDFGTRVLNACDRAAKEDGNVAVLNQSTDGVSCDVDGNLDVTCEYLQGRINYVSLPDTNHNIKNHRYQLIGGSSPASIGNFVFDPHMLRKAGVAKDLIRVVDWASDALPVKLASVDTIDKVIGCEFADIGNCSVTIVSLAFMRLRSYSVNTRKLEWKQRAIFSWATLLWVTSHHTSGSTMMTNKRNMLLESIGILFLVARSDVSQPRRATSEPNEHSYGAWRMLLREFNMEQLLRIVEKSKIKLDAIFESGLVTSRSKTYFKGYQQTYPEFIESLVASSNGGISMSGPVNVDLNMPAVDQLWDEVKGVMEVTTAWMKPFLNLFGVTEGNGLSPFATDINTPSDLMVMVKQFFRPPKRDTRGIGTVVDDNTDDDSVVELDDDEPAATSNGDSSGANIVVDHVTEIQQVDVDGDLTGDEDDTDTVAPAVDPEVAVEVENFFDVGTSDDLQYVFRTLLHCGNLNDVSVHARELVKLLQLGKSEKGAVTTASKYNSLNGRWFSQKVKKDDAGSGNGDNSTNDDGGVYIQRDSLIQLKCKRGKSESVENYRVLAFFTKSYNKWFVALEDKFLWYNEESKRQKVRVLARLMRKSGSSYEEVELKAGGDWGAKHVYCIKAFQDILNVENELCAM